MDLPKQKRIKKLTNDILKAIDEEMKIMNWLHGN